MSWFEQQLRFRKAKDDENLADAFDSLAGAVIGKRLSDAFDGRELADSAIDEILKYYHYRVKHEEEARLPESFEEQLEYRLRPFGIMRRTVTLDKGWYKNAVGPMLGTLKADGSAVALIPRSFYGYSYIDLKTGKKVKLNRKNQELIDKEAVCFYKPLPLKSLKISDLLKFMLEQLKASDIVLYIGGALLTTLIGLMTPMFTKWLFGHVLESGSMQILYALASFMLCFLIAQLFISVFQQRINSRVSIKQNVAVEAAVMSRVLSLPASFFKDYSAGELAQRASYVQSLCSTIMSSIGTTAFASLFSLIYIGEIFIYAPELVAPALTVTLATLALTVIVALGQMHIAREQMQLASKTSGMTYSMISGIQKIKLAGAEKRMFSRWAKQYSKEAAITYNPPLFFRISNTIILAISLAGTMLMYYNAVKYKVSVSDYYAFNAAYGMVSAAFMSFAQIAATIAGIKPALDMARPIMEAEPELSEGKEIVGSLHGGIELNSVSFRYSEDMPNVIENLSLKIKPGEYVAVVGSTGCGKSTLMRLLLGFEKPQKGIIYYDRKDMSRLDLKSLRRKIGVVLQDGKLFLGDIYSNIVIAAPQLSLDEAWEAARIASVDEDIKAMPMGMHTIISEGQGGISGGQRQRLMIARAVAPKPKILMFDEATSALDNITQKKVSEAIDGLNCTRIIIAHRLSTIRHADRIIVLDKGNIIEDGTYDELIEQNGFFAELVERQRIDIDADLIRG